MSHTQHVSTTEERGGQYLNNERIASMACQVRIIRPGDAMQATAEQPDTI